MLDQLVLPQAVPLSIFSLLVNLGIGLFLSLVISYHFEKFGSTLSNRSELARVLPFILLTTTLIITVVKSSLALSLGLVGALSIVRFRTPIKEPEELAYLFLAIAMGLGLGADQRLPTVIAGLTILLAITIIRSFKKREPNKNLFLSIEWKDSEDKDLRLNDVNVVIAKHVKGGAGLRRFETEGRENEATYHVNIPAIDGLSLLVDELQEKIPDIRVTFIDQNQISSL
ncbi:MAG: DUF4956 domain-containing protein [Nitrosomonadaceae bacterium]|nr:DUF4956 domain-containing protein [Nitrosomonadaceae bacterium]|tara:strand:+ start:104 stop:787 length:684 start_codon:yes stop_codon:yes gene_type:complete